jgi:thymidylate synthase ThyX
MHRFVLAELNTHRKFSRNSASSRAIPVSKTMARVVGDPALPLAWASEQSGMQGGESLSEQDARIAEVYWLQARNHALVQATALSKLGVHKSIVNRLLEPFMWHTVIISSTEWDNFFGLRCNPMAQPEIQAAAYAMRDALVASTPTLLDVGEWHLPYIQPGEDFRLVDVKRISAARCARVSYLTQDGVRDPEKDIELCERLTSADPPHASPLEHVATPQHPCLDVLGNFRGWRQFRHEALGEF